jgi:excisionase family DNA binding protein
MTTREAAERLGVSQSRIRALVVSGALRARRVGSVWLVDTDSVDRQNEFIAAGATGRSMAPRVAWGSSDLADGGGAAWLRASERYRLRRSLRETSSIDVLRRRLSGRSRRAARYRVGERDLEEVLRAEGVVRTGVSAASAYDLGLGTGGSGDAYVNADVEKALVEGFYLIRSMAGNLTLRIVDENLHLASARVIKGRRVAPRLVVGVDLADDRDARTRAAGRELLRALLDEQMGR